MLKRDSFTKFFNAVRKAGIELDITVRKEMVEFNFRDEAPFNMANWHKTILKMTKDGEISKEEYVLFQETMSDIRR